MKVDLIGRGIALIDGQIDFIESVFNGLLLDIFKHEAADAFSPLILAGIEFG